MEREIKTIKNEISEIEQSVQIEDDKEDISDLERNLENLRSQINESNKKLEELNEQLNLIEEKEKDYSDKRDKLRLESKKITDNAEKYQREFDKLEEERGRLLKNKEKSAQRYNAVLEVIKDLEKKMHECQNNLENDTNKALEICERVNVDLSTKNIQIEIGAMERTIVEEQKKKKLDIKEVEEKYRDSVETYTSLSNTVQSLSKTYQMLNVALVQRTKTWEKMRKIISNTVTYFFNMNLSNQGHNGKILFDFEQESLDIQVQLEKTKAVSKNIQQKTTELSGGESSFTTVSLLLSLWETMDTPFSAMDEFDVFMDAVNRRISVELMIKSARQKKDRQFIFITPQEVNFVHGLDITISRMNPPERGQTTLN